jgi:LysR family transcriptional regulator, glycine cleavage system transcriptional activator
MYKMPPLNALRAFEAAARHLSLTKAAQELNVSPGAVSHQIRALEALLEIQLFERRVRAIALTPAAKLLYPGVQNGFLQIQEAVASLRHATNDRVLVVSTPPGLTAKWLAARLYRFASAHPEIEVRISSSLANANFTTDGVDVAVRNLAVRPAGDPDLLIERLVELSFVPVCSPRLYEQHGLPRTADALARMPLIHDDSLSSRAKMPTWSDWFHAAGVPSVDIGGGLHFNSADHALDAASEGAGVLLAHDVLAYDDLRTGRLIIPVALPIWSDRAYYVVCPKHRSTVPQVRAFRDWIKQEVAELDWTAIRGKARPANAGKSQRARSG